MGKLIDVTPFEGMGRDEMAEARKRMSESGETRILVKAGRPDVIASDAITNVSFSDWKRYKHGEVEMVSVEEREVPGIVAILRANRDMDVRQALADLRAYMPIM